MVDRSLLGKGIADIHDAVARIRDVLPTDAAQFLSDRTSREVVVLNLFVALQQVLSLAGTGWPTKGGRFRPGTATSWPL